MSFHPQNRALFYILILWVGTNLSPLLLIKLFQKGFVQQLSLICCLISFQLGLINFSQTLNSLSHVVFSIKKEIMEFGVAHQFIDAQDHKFDLAALVARLDRSLLQSIENIYRRKQEGLDLIEFTRFFMNCFQHSSQDAPLLAAGLSQLFETIVDGKTRASFSDVTNYVCDKILEQAETQKELSRRWLPVRGHQQQHPVHLRNPPVIRGGQTEEVSKVWAEKCSLDKEKHDNIISHAFYSESSHKVYCLEGLADWIGICSKESKLQRKLRPSAFKVKKDAAVLAIAFSEREQRLGAVLKDFSLSFWDESDNYTFQKSIGTAKYCQQMQTGIWYLQYFQKWVTSDVGGVIYLWNLLTEKAQKTMSCKNRAKISDLCQIPAIGGLAVAQQQRGAHTEFTKIQLINLQRGEVVGQIDTKIERRMLHTLRYSQQYQVLLSAGYEKKIYLFEINQQYLDCSLRGELLGHQSAVTCFTLVKRTPMVASADDCGKVKIWNIRNFKCMQTLDFTDKVAITRLLDMSDDCKIAVMGSRIILLHLENPPTTVPALVPVKARSTSDKLFVFTQSDIRSFDFATGQLLKIDCRFHSNDTEITSSVVMSHGEVVTGNERGEINFYSRITDKLNQVATWHVGAVQLLSEDSINNLLLSFSDHSGFILATKNKTGQKWQQLRSLKGNFIVRDLTAIELSAYHSVFAFVSVKSVYMIDYELFKLTFEFVFEDEDPTAVTFINGLGLMLIGTSAGKIYVLEIERQTVNLLVIISCKSKSINHILTDLSCRQVGGNLQVESCPIICSFEDGTIELVNFANQANRVQFKNSKAGGTAYNPFRQTRQNFETQIKKGKFQVINLNSDGRRFVGEIMKLNCHVGGVSSLCIAEFDEHLLISTGNDGKVKIWQNHRLIGDLSINLPLPYLWDIKIKDDKQTARRVLHGLELIQIIFKRFGTDISVGESQMFKLTTVQQEGGLQRYSSNNAASLKKKKAVLFQNEFSLVDLNYDKIKKGRLIPVSAVGGPSLKLMELNRRVQTLQMEYQSAKQKQEQDKSTLLTSLQVRAQKNDEKEMITALLRDKTNCSAMQIANEKTPTIQNLEEKLERSVCNEKDSNFQGNIVSKSLKDSGVFRFTGSRNKVQMVSNSSNTLQSYFLSKYTSNERTLQVQSQKCSPRKSINNSTDTGLHKRQNSFRNMLTEMKNRLNKSKKNDFIITKGEIKSRTVKDWKHLQGSKISVGKTNATVSTFCHVEGVDNVIG